MFLLLSVLFLNWANAGPGTTDGGNLLENIRINPFQVEEIVRVFVEKETSGILLHIVEKVSDRPEKSLQPGHTDGPEERGLKKLMLWAPSNIGPEFSNHLLALIKFKGNGPCQTTEGTMHDGSSSSTGDVCVSTALLAEKLSLDDALKRIAGLVWHEFSHQAGANEEEAVAVQKLVQSWYTVDLPKLSSIEATSPLHIACRVAFWKNLAAAPEWKTQTFDFAGKGSEVSKIMQIENTPYTFTLSSIPEQAVAFALTISSKDDGQITSMGRLQDLSIMRTLANRSQFMVSCFKN